MINDTLIYIFLPNRMKTLILQKKKVLPNIVILSPVASNKLHCLSLIHLQISTVAQWKRAGPITQRSKDRNLPVLCVIQRVTSDNHCGVHYSIISSKPQWRSVNGHANSRQRVGLIILRSQVRALLEACCITFF